MSTPISGEPRYRTRFKVQELSGGGEDRAEVPQASVELIAAIDPGTDYTKCAFRVVRNAREGTLGSAGLLKTVTWLYAKEYVKTQVSYTKDAGSNNYTFRWGDEVDRAIKHKQIEVRDIIRCFKPAVFGQDVDRNKSAREKISKLPLSAREETLAHRLKQYGQEANNTEVTDIDLFVVFLRHVYWSLLRTVAEDTCDLGIPVHHRDLTLYRDWKPSANLKIRVAIPLPAASTPAQIARVIAAAEAAGIPEPFPVAEPMSALAYELRMDPDEVFIGKVILVVDIGAGSADIQAWLVVETNPLKVKQVSKSRTEWIGGRILNQEGIQFILQKDSKLNSILGTPGHGDQLKLQELLLYLIEQEFEEEKQHFDGRLDAILELDKVPHAIFPTLSDTRIELTSENLQSIWKSTIEGLRSAMYAAIQEASGLNQIVMCGGSTLNRYLRDSVKAQFHPTPVQLPTIQTGGSRTVAMGAVLLLQDKDLIKERIVRHGFCVAWWKPLSELPRQQIPGQCVEENNVDGIKRALVSKFFFAAGVSVPVEYEAPRIRGYRLLALRFLEDIGSGSCWKIQEKLYYCAGNCLDDVAVEDKANNIFEMPVSLEYAIPYSLAADTWEIQENGNEDFYEVEYEVALYLDGDRMRFQILIPRSGVFDTTDRDPRTDVRLEVKFNTAGIFDLVNRA
jgi:actin-like ATPase involved in cell morphogenesis